MKTAILKVVVEYNEHVTDAKSVASAIDVLMETALSTPDILDEYGNPDIGEFLVLSDDPESLMRCPKCGGKEICYIEDVPRVFRSYAIVEGVIIWHTDDQETCWDGCHDEQLACKVCNTEFPIPEGLEMDFE